MHKFVIKKGNTFIIIMVWSWWEKIMKGGKKQQGFAS